MAITNPLVKFFPDGKTNFGNLRYIQMNVTLNHSMIESIQDRKAWKVLLSEFEIFDYYHTFDYHQIAKNGEEEAIILRYQDDNSLVALPLIIRRIPGSDYKDATSVYGYSGPLVKLGKKEFDADRFKRELDTFLMESGIICVFSRLHPFIPRQEVCLQGLGEIQNKGNIVNIDLTRPLDMQRQEYRNRYKTYINKCRRLYTIKNAESSAEVDTFIQLYLETMNRVGAKNHYFFDASYFFELLKSRDFETELLLATDNCNGAIISGAMFIKTNGIVQYHLSGSDMAYAHLHPIKMLIDEMRIRGTIEKDIYFNLGGGLGNEEDSLFEFKSGFSNDYRPFKVWKYVVNGRAYRKLVKEKKEQERNDLHDEYSSFFPRYRFEK